MHVDNLHVAVLVLMQTLKQQKTQQLQQEKTTKTQFFQMQIWCAEAHM